MELIKGAQGVPNPYKDNNKPKRKPQNTRTAKNKLQEKGSQDDTPNIPRARIPAMITSQEPLPRDKLNHTQHIHLV